MATVESVPKPSPCFQHFTVTLLKPGAARVTRVSPLHVGAIVRREHGHLAAQGLVRALLGIDAQGIEVQIALGGQQSWP